MTPVRSQELEARGDAGAARHSILHVLGKASATSIPYEVAVHQRRLGHDVHVASVLRPLEEAQSDTEITVLGGGLRPLGRLRALIRGGRFDVVHVHHGAASLFAAVVARLARVPVIVTEHRAEGVKRSLQVARGIVGTRITCNSEFTRQSMPSALTRLRTVDVVYNGVDVAAVTAGSADRGSALWDATSPVALCVGRLIGDKGQSVLLRAAAQTEHPITVVCIGDGPDLEAIELLAAELGIADRVCMLGRQPRNVVYDAMAAAALVVVPSRTEGFCNVAAEALVAGVPLITSDAGALPEVVRDTAARMFATGDHMALAAAIDQLVDETAAGDGQRSPCFDFTLEATLGRFDEIYGSVIVR